MKIIFSKKINGKKCIFYGKQNKKTKSFECSAYIGKLRKDRECACSTKRTLREALQFKDDIFEWAWLTI